MYLYQKQFACVVIGFEIRRQVIRLFCHESLSYFRMISDL